MTQEEADSILIEAFKKRLADHRAAHGFHTHRVSEIKKHGSRGGVDLAFYRAMAKSHMLNLIEDDPTDQPAST